MSLVRDAKVGDLYQIANRSATIPVMQLMFDNNEYSVGWRDYPIGIRYIDMEKHLYTGAYLIYVGVRHKESGKLHAFKTFKGPETFLFRGKAFRHLKEIN